MTMREALVAAGALLAAVFPATAQPAPGQPWVGPGLYVPIRPCRVADTRAGGGPVAAGETRHFQVLGPTTDLSGQGGSATGCGIPVEMAPIAVVLNVVAVSPQGHGYLLLYSSNETAPATSTLNYQASNFATANGLPVAVGCGPLPHCSNPLGFEVAVVGSATHVVIDAVGYFASDVEANLGLWIRSHDPRAGIRVTAEGIGGTGMWGAATNHNGIGLFGSSAQGIGVAGSSTDGVPIAVLEGKPGTLVDFRGEDGNSRGEISLAADGETVSYNAFTGSHYAWSEAPIEPGTLVSLSGTNARRHGDAGGEVLHGVRPTARANDPAVLGVYAGRLHPARPDQSFDANPGLVQAVGNGEVWVVDTGSDVEPGDLLVSAALAGHAMKIPADIETAFVVARAAERVPWSDVTADARGRRRAKVAVLFEPGMATSNAALRAELATLRAANDQLRATLATVLAAFERHDRSRVELTAAQPSVGPGHANTAEGPD